MLWPIAFGTIFIITVASARSPIDAREKSPVAQLLATETALAPALLTSDVELLGGGSFSVGTSLGHAMIVLPDQPIQIGLLCVTTFCTLFGCSIIGMSLRGRGVFGETPGASSGLGLGIQTYMQLGIVLLFIGLSIVHTFTQHEAGRTGYSVVSATVLIYLLKTIVANIMYVTKAPDTYSVRDLMKASHPKFPRTPAFVLLLVPSCLFAIYDVLSFLSLNMLDPVTYRVVSSCRILLIAGLWQPALGRRLSSMQMTALAFFFVASVSKGVDQVSGAGGSSAHIGVFCVLCQVLVSAVANVSSEVCLKELPLHTDLLNSCAYFESFLLLLAGLTLSKGPGSVTEMLTGESWRQLAGDPFMVVSILVLAVIGVTTAYLLRDLSNILKELSIGVVLIVTAVIEYIILGSASFSCLSASSVVLTILALWIYNLNPVVVKPVKPDSKPKCEDAEEASVKPCRPE